MRIPIDDGQTYRRPYQQKRPDCQLVVQRVIIDITAHADSKTATPKKSCCFFLGHFASVRHPNPHPEGTEPGFCEVLAHIGRPAALCPEIITYPVSAVQNSKEVSCTAFSAPAIS
jgi:hypothetical protein